MEYKEKKIEVLFEDKDVLVIDKPSGLVVTREGVLKDKTLEELLPESNLARKGIVHRIDKGTSGILLIAKNQKALSYLKEQFKKRKVKKKYMALVWGETSKEGSINFPIGRSNYVFDRWAVREDGKRAVTNFKLIKNYHVGGKEISLIEVGIETGRTHQIRVHFSFLKWSLVGDRLYGGKNIDDLKRIFLHASELTFEHPKTKKMMTINCHLPKDLSEMLKKYDN